MNQLILAFCAWLSLGAAALADSTSGPSIRVYQWVDEQGVSHYGDHIPPEYATQEHRVLNGRGIEIERADAQKNPEQLAEEERNRLDASQRASRDHNLLTAYGSVQEIEHLRDQRLALLSDQIKVTGQFLDSLNKKLGTLTAASARFKPYNADPNAPRMTDQMAEDLVRVGTDIRTQRDNLQEKRTEAASMSRQFDSDIARFKELKGIH